jgi:hypothetical protein
MEKRVSALKWVYMARTLEEQDDVQECTNFFVSAFSHGATSALQRDDRSLNVTRI